jgi:hypothetical protein
MKFLRGSYKTKNYVQNCRSVLYEHDYVPGNDMSLMLYWERLFYIAVSTIKKRCLPYVWDYKVIRSHRGYRYLRTDGGGFPRLYMNATRITGH